MLIHVSALTISGLKSDETPDFIDITRLLGFKLVGWQGLEPWTNALKGHCSTN
jgi:hypothetical protein